MKLIEFKNIVKEEMKNLIEIDYNNALEKAIYQVYSDAYMIPNSNWRMKHTVPMLSSDGKVYYGKIGEIHTLLTIDYDLLHNGEVVTKCNDETYSIETGDFRNAFEMISDVEGLKINNESIRMN